MKTSELIGPALDWASREPDVVNAHERAAREVQRLIHREMIN